MKHLPIVLIVDDNYATQKLTGTILKKAGYSIDIAQNGIEALSALSQKRYHIILMDCNMPQMNGIEATKKIRQEPSYADIIIIGTTPAYKSIDKEQCLSIGMNDFLPKPISKESLTQCIAHWAQTIA